MMALDPWPAALACGARGFALRISPRTTHLGVEIISQPVGLEDPLDAHLGAGAPLV